MASVYTSKSYTLVLTEIEAVVLLGMTDSVSGNEQMIGRRETSSIGECLRLAGVTPMAPDSGTWIEWHKAEK